MGHRKPTLQTDRVVKSFLYTYKTLTKKERKGKEVELNDGNISIFRATVSYNESLL